MVPDFDGMFRLAAFLIILFVPLGLWKLIEIIVWLCNHVRIGVS